MDFYCKTETERGYKFDKFASYFSCKINSLLFKTWQTTGVWDFKHVNTAHGAVMQ